MKTKNIHITLTVGGETKLDADTDLFAGVYSTSDCVERVMMLESDYLTLAEGSIMMGNLCHSLLTSLREKLGDEVTGKLLDYLHGIYTEQDGKDL